LVGCGGAGALFFAYVCTLFYSKKNEGPIAPSLPPPLRRAVENIIKMHEYLPISFVHKMMVLVHDEISRQISFASSEFSDPQTSRPKRRRSVLEAFFVVEKITMWPNCT
jgi:hypothetical protein